MPRFSVEPIDATFGAIVTNIQLAGLDTATFKQLYATWLDYALLIFPDQHLGAEDQCVFAECFGSLEFPLDIISNLKPDGTPRGNDSQDDVINILKGNMGWHCDSTYMPIQSKCAIFSAHVVPSSGGGTAWADMRAAYQALPAETQEQIAGLRAYHSLYYSQAKLGHVPKEESDYDGYGFHDQDPPLRPLVKIHPETRQPTLMIGRHAYGIPGMTTDQSERFLDELTQLACQPPRTHQHCWNKGDVAVWDNRSLMHRACPWDMNEPRVIYNFRIAGDPTTEFAAAHL